MIPTRRIALSRPSQMFDSFLDEFFNTPMIAARFRDLDIDMYEENDNVVVKAKLPGVEENQTDISIEDNVLTITGNIENTTEEEDKKKKYYFKEISSESFSRSIQLPTRVDAENSKADFKNGILAIVMPKVPEVKPKKISIGTTK